MYKADDRSMVSPTPSHHADHGKSSTHRLSPRDEPHPYSLRRRRDSGITHRQSMSENNIYYRSYRERARRASLAYQRFPLSDDPEPLPLTRNSDSNLPPPYNSGGSPPPYTSISRSQDDSSNMVPSSSRSGQNNRHRWRQSLSFLRPIR